MVAGWFPLIVHVRIRRKKRVSLWTRLRWDSLSGELVMMDHTKSDVGGR